MAFSMLQVSFPQPTHSPHPYSHTHTLHTTSYKQEHHSHTAFIPHTTQTHTPQLDPSLTLGLSLMYLLSKPIDNSAHHTHALSYANNIKQILALGAVWLAKGPKIAGRSYYCLFIFYLSFVQPWSTTFVFVVSTLNLSEHKFVANWPPLTFTAKLNNQFRQKQCCFSFRELAKEDIKFQLKPHFFPLRY